MKRKIMIAAVLLMALPMASCRGYEREQDRLDKESEGKGDLLKAESTKKVKIEQAKADLESAKLDAQTAVTQANAEAERQLIKANSESRTKVIYSKAKAEAILLEAEAEAKANEKIAKSITPAIIEYNKVNKWNGKLPTTSVGAGSSTIIGLK